MTDDRLPHRYHWRGRLQCNVRPRPCHCTPCLPCDLPQRWRRVVLVGLGLLSWFVCLACHVLACHVLVLLSWSCCLGVVVLACLGVLPWFSCLGLPVRVWGVWGPNATLQARGIAGARNERTLFPVACKRLLGAGVAGSPATRSPTDRARALRQGTAGHGGALGGSTGGGNGS